MIDTLRKYGWKRDLPDHRDLLFHEHNEVLADDVVANAWDLSEHCPPIYDQGQLGSCTANGWARVMEYRQNVQGEGTVTPSRLFIYYNERAIEGDIGQDTGAQVRTGAKVVSTLGVPSESDWPYDITKFTIDPPQQAYTDAKEHLALQYQRIVITRGASMRTAISKGLPIVFGFSVPDYFETNDGWSFDQPLPLPGPDTQIIGGHCCVITGYDFTRTRFPVNAFQIDNSWGTDWGLGGRFWMNAHWFGNLATDMWCVQQVS